ncbi:MAG: glutathione synthase, partial [Methylobacteriaceae bacterium]|nr:glutathione synthase [Methylobacteriaceae bacterium]
MLKVAVQMDPIEKIKIAGDSTFALMLAAQERGHRLFYYTPDRMSLSGNTVLADLAPVEVRDKEGDHYKLGPASLTDLSEMDVVLLRQDPPFDLAYITSTHFLEHLQPKTLVVNDPA